MTSMPLEQFRPLVSDLDHPESVAWGLDGNFYAGGEAGQIYQVSPDGACVQLAATRGLILGLCLDAANAIYACDSAHHAVLCITPDGEISSYTNGSPDRAMRSPNGLVFDDQGNLYVSDSGQAGEDNGCLYLVRPGGHTELINAGLRQNPNGLALSPDGRFLHVVMTRLHAVLRLPRLPDARLGEPETVVQLPHTMPDGAAFDQQGGLFISCDTPNTLYYLPADGKLAQVVEDWQRTTLASPTGLAFGGADMRTLVVANLGRTTLVQARVDTPGQPLHYHHIRA